MVRRSSEFTMKAEERARDPQTPPDELRRLLPELLDEVLSNPALPLLLLEEPSLALEIEKAMLPRAAKQVEDQLTGASFRDRHVFALLCAERSAHLAEGPVGAVAILQLVRREVELLGPARTTVRRIDEEYRLRKAIDERSSNPEHPKDMAREAIVLGLVASTSHYAARAAMFSAHALAGGMPRIDPRRALLERRWQVDALSSVRSSRPAPA